MKFLFSLGLLAFVFSFCNLSERLSKLTSENTNGQKTATNSSTDSNNSSSDTRVEKPELTSAQEAVLNSGESGFMAAARHHFYGSERLEKNGCQKGIV